MEVILMEKIANLGQLGDIVKVKNGFARNYLIPQGKARRATPAAIEEFQSRRADLEKLEADKLAVAQEKAQKLDGLMLQVSRKAGMDGKLFGSVTNSDVADLLEAQGLEVPRSIIRMPQGAIKQIGDYPIHIVLHSDVTVTVTVSVLGES
jgi:large subunit ribosomal protein L9